MKRVPESAAPKKASHILFFVFWIVAPLLWCTGCAPDAPSKTQERTKSIAPLFKKVNTDRSNLIFSNTINENSEANHLNYEYVYAGGGVAVGDINNDGLEDIYLVGNQVADRLFLNRGNLEFEDISAQAGIQTSDDWHTGATMADVNADGWLDIYVPRSGWYTDPTRRSNLLFINNQDNTFSEQAADFGLNDTNHNIQASFFDYDKDGDLDMYSMGHPAGMFGLKVSIREYLEMIRSGQVESDKLFRNDNGHFTDVSAQAGISDYGFGLGISTTDINQDGWPDIYIANDYEEPDILYINNQKGGFINQIQNQTRHISNYSMGVDIADFNNDLLVDIFTADMSFETHERSKRNMPSMSPDLFWTRVAIGWHYQYMANTLQLNNGNGTFSEIGQLAGVNKTDWSWGALFADFDSDGLKDLVITNGVKIDMFDNDAPAIINNQAKSGNIQLDELISLYPSSKRANYLYKNNGDFTFSNVSQDWGFSEEVNSNGVAYADFDLDGDLDLIINNMDQEASLYENTSSDNLSNHFVQVRLTGPHANTEGIGATVYVYADDLKQMQEVQPTRGYQTRVSNKLFFGLGKRNVIDSVVVSWPDQTETVLNNPTPDQVHIVDYSEQKTAPKHRMITHNLIQKTDIARNLQIDFTHQENRAEDYKRQVLLPHAYSQCGPSITTGDVNGDGTEDFYIGGAAGQPGCLYVQQDNGTFIRNSQDVWNADRAYEDVGNLLFDADNDGDLDLYIVSGGYEFAEEDERLNDRLYLNNGSGTFTRAERALPDLRVSGQSIAAGDVDMDGDTDLFIGGRIVPGKYPLSPKSYLLLNDRGTFTLSESANSVFQNLGLITDSEFVDIDGDDDLDLVVVGEWMSPQIFENTKGTFTNTTSQYGLNNYVGWWYSLEIGDFDGDGSMDLLCGNLGKNHKFKASPEKPLHIYYGDFDQNGMFDPILAHEENKSILPYRGRECSSEQMPFVAEKFKDFNSFASASVSDILDERMLQSGGHFEATTMTSMLFERNKDGQYKGVSLPNHVQFAPLMAITRVDEPGQGSTTLLLAGNMLDVEIETIRYDGGVGTKLKIDTNGPTATSLVEQGIYLPYNVRDLEVMTLANGDTVLLVASNNDRLRVFKIDPTQG